MEITFNNTKAKKDIESFVRNNYRKIKPKPGLCRYNFRCQMNAVHDAFSNNDKKIAMVMCIEGDWIYIHFINYHDKEFIDNTLGVWSTVTEYYFVRWIKKYDFFKVNDIFSDYRRFLQTQLSWWVRNTSNETF